MIELGTISYVAKTFGLPAGVFTLFTVASIWMFRYFFEHATKRQERLSQFVDDRLKAAHLEIADLERRLRESRDEIDRLRRQLQECWERCAEQTITLRPAVLDDEPE